MRRSLRSFTFFMKEHKRTLSSFWFHKSHKNDKSRKKKKVKERSVLFIRLKNNLTFFCNIYLYIYIFMYIYISVYIYIYVSIYLYIEKKKATFCVLLQKNETFLRSLMFFAKEQKVLCVLLHSLQKNVAFSAFFYILK